MVAQTLRFIFLSQLFTLLQQLVLGYDLYYPVKTLLEVLPCLRPVNLVNRQFRARILGFRFKIAMRIQLRQFFKFGIFREFLTRLNMLAGRYSFELPLQKSLNLLHMRTGFREFIDIQLSACN